MDVNTLVIGFLIFLARICDVSIGTVRTIVTMQGRSVIAFFLAIFELLIWITVASTVIHKIKDQPILALFYAFGYATGNVVGIEVERKIALGIIVLRVFSRTAGKKLADRLRNMGQPVTIFRGEGMIFSIYRLAIRVQTKINWIPPCSRHRREPELFLIQILNHQIRCSNRGRLEWYRNPEERFSYD